MNLDGAVPVPAWQTHNLVLAHDVKPGESRTVQLTISKSYAGADIRIPVSIWRGEQTGPTVVLTAAIHGDEINGTGIIRQILTDRVLDLKRGTLILVPVVNMFGFERHTRYMPDRRDLNRCFPGSYNGSLASRMARSFFDQVARNADYGIDLHTAAVRRTNFPNVRADLSDPKLAEFARAFGSELLIDGRGPKGSFRNAACRAGCATLILEAGEVWKVEQTIVEYALRGIRNCLAFLEMIDDEMRPLPYCIITDSTKWIRAREGGFLTFHAAPGDIVAKGDPIATNTSLTGDKRNLVRAPRDGIVLGMTTLPAVSPGSPICHLAYAKKGELRKHERAVGRLDDDSLYGRIKDDLAVSLMVRHPDSN